MNAGLPEQSGPKADIEIAAPNPKDHIMHRAADDCSHQSANGSEASGGCRLAEQRARVLVKEHRIGEQNDRNGLRQHGILSPFPVSPEGKPGRGRFPPRREHDARQQKRLARIVAAGSPHKLSARVARVRPGEELGSCGDSVAD
jgi:hypothetical protein